MKNILIGFLGASCIFLMIGATSEVSERGKYQAIVVSGNKVRLIDTETGQYFRLINRGKNEVYWVTDSKENFFRDKN